MAERAVSDLYERDFHAWAIEQASLLRAGKLAAVDVAHVTEEIESIGRTERRELVNRLVVLLLQYMNNCSTTHSGEQITVAIEGGDLPQVVEHPNQAKSPRQMIMIVGIDVYGLPFAQSDASRWDCACRV